MYQVIFSLVLVAGLVGLGGAALAQIPSTPSLPDPPPAVTGAVAQVAGTAYPYLYDAASEASVVATAGGFALRPVCAEASFGAVVLALAGPSLPLPILGLASPVFVFCGGAFQPGPADPVLKQVDSAVGPTLGQKWNGAVGTVRKNVATVPQLGTYFEQGCSLVSFAPPSSEFPPPTQRFGYSQIFCGS